MKKVRPDTVLKVMGSDKAIEMVTEIDERGRPSCTHDMTLLDVLQQNIVKAKSQNADRSVKVWKLGDKVLRDGWKGDLEDAELELLIEIVEANPADLFDGQRGSALSILRSAMEKEGK